MELVQFKLEQIAKENNYNKPTKDVVKLFNLLFDEIESNKEQQKQLSYSYAIFQKTCKDEMISKFVFDQKVLNTYKLVKQISKETNLSENTYRCEMHAITKTYKLTEEDQIEAIKNLFLIWEMLLENKEEYSWDKNKDIQMKCVSRAKKLTNIYFSLFGLLFVHLFYYFKYFIYMINNINDRKVTSYMISKFENYVPLVEKILNYSYIAVMAILSIAIIYVKCKHSKLIKKGQETFYIKYKLSILMTIYGVTLFFIYSQITFAFFMFICLILLIFVFPMYFYMQNIFQYNSLNLVRIINSTNLKDWKLKKFKFFFISKIIRNLFSLLFRIIYVRKQKKSKTKK